MKSLTELLTMLEGHDVPSDCRPESFSGSENLACNSQKSDFNDFIPLSNSEPLPPFPINEVNRVCPTVGEFIFAASESIQTSLDLVGSCTLGVLMTACGGHFPVRLPNGHIERPCLYIAPIAPPSERKSGVIAAVTAPLLDFENEYNRKNASEVSKSESKQRLILGRIAKAEQEAIKGNYNENELEKLNVELANFKATEPLRLFGADVTPEKLACMLKSQSGIFALISAEGGGIFENIGRYSDKGGLEIYLNAYSGDRVCVDRKTSESIVIDNPTLNIIAPCQPSVISDLFSDRGKAERGLLSRMLFVKCYSLVGKRTAFSEPISESVLTNYRNLVANMLSRKESSELQFDKGGLEVYCRFFNEIEKMQVDELKFMSDWAGKLPGQMIRIAGLIHCINSFSNNKKPSLITADETNCAVTLARYFLAHAKAVYNEQSEPREIRNAKYLWQRIKSLKSGKFSKRDLTRKVQDKTDFDYSESLNILINRGYIILDNIITDAKKPSQMIIVNPEAVK
jgi:uncharacterized protein YnzC (UPF0291/DUF896 family)